MNFFDRYDAINPLSLTNSVNLIAPFAQGEFLRPEHIVKVLFLCSENLPHSIGFQTFQQLFERFNFENRVTFGEGQRIT